MKTIIFDLDDTLIWDQKSIETALTETANYVTSVKGIPSNLFLQTVRDIAPKLYATYDTYSFIQKIGINPFEGLWGIFDDVEPGFSRLREVAREYQRNVWYESMKAFDIDDNTFAKELQSYFRKQRIDHPFFYDETIDVLDKVYGNYQLGLLTNGAPSLQNTKLSLMPELHKYFEHIVISGEFGVGKPDPRIFEHTLNLFGISSDDAWMVGDNLRTDILGANQVGITSVWINHHHENITDIQPTHEIKKLGELIDLLS